ncbi:MAG: cation transporter [Acidobacteriaceae bacterium]|nr:cation transporter [Acidobacteriaceae bacterium]MBV9296615.1 cation transporter [Acidobacteriaceae bacterium]MBV9764999.1 cation transporter [Acidobacteriaceae bacterium]
MPAGAKPTYPAARPPLYPDQEDLIGRRIALLSMSVGVLLAAAKIVVGIHAGSTSVVSDGLEAVGDVLSSAIVYAGLWLASKPPDYEHPYGHGRYETLAGLAVGALLLLAGAAIFWHGFTGLGEQTHLRPYALYPLIAAVALKIGLAATKFRVGKRIASTSLEADAWHDLTDLLSTSVALVAVGLTLANPIRFGKADHAGGMVIGIVIFFLSIQVVRRTVELLVDTMPNPGKMGQIRQVALSVPGALAIEKCFARRTGLKYHVDLHLEVDPEMTVRESHEIATQVKFEIKQHLHWVADVLVHVEPSSTPSLHVSHRRSAFEPVDGE